MDVWSNLTFTGVIMCSSKIYINSYTDLSWVPDSFPDTEVADSPTGEETEHQLPSYTAHLFNASRDSQHTTPGGGQQKPRLYLVTSQARALTFVSVTWNNVANVCFLDTFVDTIYQPFWKQWVA